MTSALKRGAVLIFCVPRIEVMLGGAGAAGVAGAGAGTAVPGWPGCDAAPILGSWPVWRVGLVDEATLVTANVRTRALNALSELLDVPPQPKGQVNMVSSTSNSSLTRAILPTPAMLLRVGERALFRYGWRHPLLGEVVEVAMRRLLITLYGLTALLHALAGLFIASTAMYAHGGACQKVDITVNNQKSVKIKALKIEYKSKEDGKWRTEDFTNTEVAKNTKKTVANNQNLSYIEGHDMSSIKLHYKKWCGGKWSKTYTTTDSRFDKPKCNSNSNKNYRVDVPSGGC